MLPDSDAAVKASPSTPAGVKPMSGGGLAALAIRIGGLWLLAGALFKLFLGTPADLPQIVRELPMSLALSYKVIIGVEMCVASLALLRPHWGWPVLAAVFLVFEAVLVSQIAAGAETCGCFGAKIPMPPWLMLLIDTVLLGALLLARPWAGVRGGVHPAFVAGALVVGVALPWALDREAVAPPAGAGGTASGPKLGRYVVLDLPKMVGQPIAETEIAKWLEEDVNELPPDGLWILWRWNCEHCAAHLEHLVANPPPDPFLVLVRLKEKEDREATRKVFVLPSGPNVIETAMRDDVTYVITTPGELVLQDGIILSARERADLPSPATR